MLSYDSKPNLAKKVQYNKYINMEENLDYQMNDNLN